MKLRALYDHSIRYAARLDVRGEDGLRRVLEQRRREYESLLGWERETYDLERLTNPFGDVRLAYSPTDPNDLEIRTILLGIDISVPELLLADHLRTRGVPIDAVVAHHTPNAGIAFNLAHDIMDVNVEMLTARGVPRADAERVIGPYVHERWLNNEDFIRQGVATARRLGLPFGCIHTPADYAFEKGISGVVESYQPKTTGEVVRALMTIPEVQSAAHVGAFPRVMSGDESWPLGRYMVKGGGGRIFPPGAYPLLGAAGVNTVIQIGCGAAHAHAAQEAGVCIVRVPHAACDNIGINLWLDEAIRELGSLEVIGCAAFERITRTTERAA
jgi:hypothetical protein